jgi:hypothetical protein
VRVLEWLPVTAAEFGAAQAHARRLGFRLA